MAQTLFRGRHRWCSRAWARVSGVGAPGKAGQHPWKARQLADNVTGQPWGCSVCSTVPAQALQCNVACAKLPPSHMPPAALSYLPSFPTRLTSSMGTTVVANTLGRTRFSIARSTMVVSLVLGRKNTTGESFHSCKRWTKARRRSEVVREALVANLGRRIPSQDEWMDNNLTAWTDSLDSLT